MFRLHRQKYACFIGERYLLEKKNVETAKQEGDLVFGEPLPLRNRRLQIKQVFTPFGRTVTKFYRDFTVNGRV